MDRSSGEARSIATPIAADLAHTFAPMDSFCDLATLAAAIPDGATVAVPSAPFGVAMAATRELVRRPAKGLRLVCVPTSSIQADALIGAGCVAAIETSAVSIGEYGTGPRFAAAARDGSVRILDATCPAIHAGIQAGMKGLPFVPLRGLLGSDLVANRPDWKVIDNPFAPGDPVVVLPAIRPDVALFHAPRADKHGNVFIGRSRDLVNMAQAARATFITVEERVEDDLLQDPDRAGAVIPALYVDRIALAPRGAWPLGLPGRYAPDDAALGRYAQAARTREGFATWLTAWLATAPASAAA
jgi:glutaconate CoA-transferase subunit A